MGILRMLASTLFANKLIAAVASIRVIRTTGWTAAVNARERSGTTLLSILAGRIVTEADRGFARQVGRHEDNNFASRLVCIASSAMVLQCGGTTGGRDLTTHNRESGQWLLLAILGLVILLLLGAFTLRGHFPSRRVNKPPGTSHLLLSRVSHS
jgi:hypothetical protein